MTHLDARAVFYVKDGERALSFYTETLGFSLDWNYAPNGRAFVFQVSMLGFRLILNEIEERTEARAGCGRVFIGLEDDQVPDLKQHFEHNGIQAEVVPWGAPTLLVRDLDGNWITFWLPEQERESLEIGQSWPE